MTQKGLKEHIYREKSCKTVCVSNVLGYLGIPLSFYQSTGTNKNKLTFINVARRFGYAVRSRKSSLPKTVGSARSKIVKLDDPVGTKYMIHVPGHLLLLNEQGETIVDTSPRKRDKRRILNVWAVFPKS